jgi:hypothetical protein
MDLESREQRINAILRNLLDQGVTQDWVDKIVEGVNSMLERDPVVGYVRDQAMLALTAMRKRKAAAAKAPTNGIDELMSWLEMRFWDGRVLENLRAMLKPGERVQEVDYFVVVTNQRRITRDEAKQFGRTVAETNDAYYARQFTNDDKIREAEAAERSREEPRPQYGRNFDFPGGIRPGR